MDHQPRRDKAHWHGLYSTKQWQSLRKHRLSNNPLCKYCLEVGKTTYANVVDHITPHKGDTSLFYDYENTQSLCKRCHDSVKQAYEKSGHLRGCDRSGFPIDKHHHWGGGG